MTNQPATPDAPTPASHPDHSRSEHAESSAIDRAARHRAAQARYAKSDKGRAKRREWNAGYVRSGRKAEAQRRYYANLSERQYSRMLFRNNQRRRQIADASDTAHWARSATKAMTGSDSTYGSCKTRLSI